MQEAIAYEKHKNLKLAAEELGISWHTLYSRLKRSGVPVTGDKLRYGSDRDRLAAKAEDHFKRLVPFAAALNEKQWQAKYDFSVLGLKVDVKASSPRKLNKRCPALSWSFSMKKQALLCDFICCFCMATDGSVSRILLVPSEFFEGLQTISVSCAGSSKWLDYEVPETELAQFFKDVA